MSFHSKSLIAAVAGTIAVLGCRDAATPPTAIKAASDQPSFTATSGFTGGLLVHSNVGTFHEKAFDHFNIELKSHDDTDMDVVSQVGAPGAQSGWHSHLGPVLVSVKSGTFVVYLADDPSCTPHVYTAGATFIEGTKTHIVRNEGATNAEFVAVFFMPANAARRVDQPNPGNCPF